MSEYENEIELAVEVWQERCKAKDAQLAALTLERDAARETLAKAEAIAEASKQDRNQVWTSLGAWHTAFGTQQLTHAVERLRGAERERDVSTARAEAAEEERDAARAAEKVQTERVAEFRRQRDEAIAERDRLRDAAELALSLQDTARYDEGMMALSDALAQPTTERK